jgi:hypothetical protein
MRVAQHPFLLTLATLAIIAVFASACRGKRSAATSSADPNQLVIVKATWGATSGPGKADVTKLVAGLVQGNGLRIEASPRVLGDPADLKLKQLRVEWSRGGVVGARIVSEGETFNIGATEKPVPIRTVVTKAVYGNLASGKTVDVTPLLAEWVTDNVLSVTPTNQLFGDPAAGQAKQLRVDYTFDGVAKSKTANENEPLTISAEGE